MKCHVFNFTNVNAKCAPSLDLWWVTSLLCVVCVIVCLFSLWWTFDCYLLFYHSLYRWCNDYEIHVFVILFHQIYLFDWPSQRSTSFTNQVCATRDRNCEWRLRGNDDGHLWRARNETHVHSLLRWFSGVRTHVSFVVTLLTVAQLEERGTVKVKHTSHP